MSDPRDRAGPGGAQDHVVAGSAGPGIASSSAAPEIDLGEELADEEIEAMVRAIENGEDDYPVPEELLVDVEPEPDRPPQEEEEKRLSLSAQIRGMGVGQKIKLALKGGREARGLLFRDANRIIKRLVLQNPRLSEDEMITMAKNRSEDVEFLESIAKKKEAAKNYQIRLALVTNPKTPIPLSMRLVNTLFERDLRQIAKSKNVPAAVNSAAKRLLFQRESKQG